MKFFSLLILGLMLTMFVTSLHGIKAQDIFGSGGDGEEGSDGEVVLPDAAQEEYDALDLDALINGEDVDVDGDGDDDEAGGDVYYKNDCGKDIKFKKFYWIKKKKITIPAYVKRPVEVTFTDLGCPCEQFEIIIDGVSQGYTSDPKKDAHCYYPIKDGRQASNDFRYSARKITLYPGKYTIQIRTKQACKYFGKFAIGARYDDGTCCRGDNFKVVRYPVKGKNAKDVCHYFGYDFAEIDAWNLKEATNVAFTCLGKNSEAWVKSWNGDSYKGTCVALFVGHSSRHGTIAEPYGGCYAKNPTLCQERPKYPWS
eukprot:gb/GECH01011007.1/.p1 GENE.gb/GECH01011007.1/~~gb/GECH01011007.1/.p1  ORF type:complete len:312 (+),score=87.81 gb/GECH01011007.1/:1-936(+)